MYIIYVKDEANGFGYIPPEDDDGWCFPVEDKSDARKFAFFEVKRVITGLIAQYSSVEIIKL